MSHARGYCEIDFPLPSHPGQRITAAFSEPEEILVAHRLEEVPALLDKAEQCARSGRWAVGFVAYEAAAAFDQALHTQPAAPAGMPYAWFAVFRASGLSQPMRGDHLCGAWRDETPRDRFDQAIADIRQGITSGDYYQVNYTTRLRSPFFGNSLSFFDSLRASQPAAYCAYLDIGHGQLCSVSPELFFHWDADKGSGRHLACRPMKGTAARHADPDDDQRAAIQLRQSEKERAENLMIVDLVRNDMSRVAQPGSVTANALFSVEAWPTVWQMTSTVNSRTRPDTRLRDVFRAMFPCGSVTGAPKAAAMSAIQNLESSARGAYCGAIGLLMPGGEALFSVGIRTPVVHAASGAAECGIGSGIMLDSAADMEYAEWQAKQAFLMQACPEYQLLETLRLHQGRYWLLRGHLKRLARSAAALGFFCDERNIYANLQSAARQSPTGNWRARLLLAADGKSRVELFPLDPPPVRPKAALAAMPMSSSNPWLQHKTTRREPYAAISSRKPGIFDTLLYNERGELTEFTRGNLVLERNGHLLTPPAQCGLLPGVMRDMLLTRKRVQESILHFDDLQQARRIWLINSVRGAIALEMETSK